MGVRDCKSAVSESSERVNKLFQITPEGFKKLANGCVNLQSLLLNDFPTLNDDCMVPISIKCTRLHTLSFLGSPLLSDEAFRKLANNRNLKKLKIEGKNILLWYNLEWSATIKFCRNFRFSHTLSYYSGEPEGVQGVLLNPPTRPPPPPPPIYKYPVKMK